MTMREQSGWSPPGIGRFVFAMLVLVLGTTSPAAAIDLSGDYVGSNIAAFTITAVQTGTSLQMMGDVVFGPTTYRLSATGTVDPATGAFSVSGEITGLCPDFVISGTGVGDGEEIEELTGTFTSSRICPSGPVLFTKCGNGVIDPLENCEDGNSVDGDCCSARCRLDPAGTTCTSDRNDCTDDVCNETGACMHVLNTSPCDDGNACTFGDLCAAGACVPGSPAAGEACEDDFDPCTADICDAAGTCTHMPVSPAECRARTACHSTCTQQLKACRQTCPGRGQARRECLAACAGRSTCTAPGAAIRTLAYVVTDCTSDPQGRTALKQKLLIRRGNCDPITVTEVTGVPPSEPILDPGHCAQFGFSRFGSSSVALGALQRLGVSPNGSGVVFEVNDEFSTLPLLPSTLLPPEKKGFFFVRADGTGRRSLGPASQEHSFAGGVTGFAFPPPISFSPNGRRIAFTDRGPGPGGVEAAQIVVLDLPTGRRTPVTHLPSGTAPATVFGPFLLTCCPTFIDDETILFGTFVDPVVDSKHLNPEHHFAAFTVRIDGSHFTALPTPVALEGSTVVSTFGVTGRRTNLVRLSLPGTPVSNPVPPGCGVSGVPCADFPINEVFLQDGKRLLQLTELRSADTFIGFMNGTRTRAFFMSSVDPLVGTNPHGNCQIFSVDTFGGGLRQVTHFNQGGSPPSVPGCFGAGPPACSVGEGYLRVVFQDPVTNTVVFASSCDPFGTNPYGGQLFAMRPDGHGLCQLTDAAGLTGNPDGSVHVELPGPFAYSAAVP
jgi:cysteine-rich repeat protein